MRIRDDGHLHLLDEPEQMEVPKAAFKNNPFATCSLDLAVKAAGPAWGGEPEADDGEELAATEDGQGRVHGFLYDRARYGDDRTVSVRQVEMTSDYDEDGYHRAVHAKVTTDDHTYALDGEVWSNIPLRNQRNGQMTRDHRGHDALAVRGDRRGRFCRVPRPDRRREA